MQIVHVASSLNKIARTSGKFNEGRNKANNSELPAVSLNRFSQLGLVECWLSRQIAANALIAVPESCKFSSTQLNSTDLLR
jgi:hypothetical protein